MKQQTCNQYQGLVPGYMDGELTEEQAGPLRDHLLACLPCRSEAQNMTNLSRWFQAPPAVTIPKGFAARVAQAAFGQFDEAETETAPQPKAAPLAPVPETTEARILPFVLTMTSLAAGLLLCLAFVMAQEEQPSGAELSAEPLPSILEELDRLNDSSPEPAPLESGR